jgi:hypothetical protein
VKGYADRQIAHILRCLESEVHAKRMELGIQRVYKMVDTCAAEFEAKTPYFYSTFDGENESVRERKEEDRGAGLRSEQNRSGHRVRLQLCARRAGGQGVRLRDHHDQL